jgi:hypothetical protein
MARTIHYSKLNGVKQIPTNSFCVSGRLPGDVC